ncbi:hypothetical protein C6P45_002377 [Maudiozyma exigua]|uniref:Zinc finger PHD-type domain-containing protein n=1 Tax=Maudiozyma exigua TaxID=34358 RepID=A0A9P6WDS7_MAUEX|nr:hypothetical protein C6P45_002377 [Kazachstania exigua]
MSDEEEITRCVCGEQEPADESGLYIQCEECSVWQHGFCVGIVEDVPDKYWCEQCKPELHDLYTDEEARKRSHYLPVQEGTIGKDSEEVKENGNDSEINEEDKEDKHDDIAQKEESAESKEGIASDNKSTDHKEDPHSSPENEEDNHDNEEDEEDKEDHEDEEGDFHELSKRASRSSREEQQYQRMLEQAIKESQMDAPGDKTKAITPILSTTEDTNIAESEQPELKATSISEFLDENIETTEQDSQTDATEAESNRLNKTDDNDDNRSTSSKDKQRTIKKPSRVTKKPRRTKSKRNLSDGKRTNSNNKNKEKSVDVTATNSVKPRLPSQRTTMNEMRRRTSAILQFISRTQWDLENVQKERADLIRFIENDQFIEKIDHIFTQNNEALTMMNELTQNLLNWEKNYSNEN